MLHNYYIANKRFFQALWNDLYHLAPRRVLVPLQVGVASLKGKAPDKQSGTILIKKQNESRTISPSRILTRGVNISALSA